jgi:prephenate dehydrogenase
MSQPAEGVATQFATIAIVGVGLIGGSLAAAIKRRSLARTVIGVGRDAVRMAKARERGLIDEAATHLGQAAASSDMLIFCTPVDRIVSQVREAAAACRSGTLVTDAGSVKGTICAGLASGLPAGVGFVGSHPLAGSEKQGFEYADAELFQGRVCVVTPLPASPRQAIDRVRRFWEGVGSTVLEMSPEDHDRALAATSHVPHVVAAALAAILDADKAPLAASGFRDATRIAAGDPELWSAILLANRDSILSSLQNYEHSLRKFHEALAARDAQRLKELLLAAKSKRDGLVAERN